LPVGFGVVFVAVVLPCGDFVGEDLLVGDAATAAAADPFPTDAHRQAQCSPQDAQPSRPHASKTRAHAENHNRQMTSQPPDFPCHFPGGITSIRLTRSRSFSGQLVKPVFYSRSS
jgi:hypothetical protein